MQATLQATTAPPKVNMPAKRLVRCAGCSQFLELPPEMSIDHSRCPCCQSSLANSVLCSVHLGSEPRPAPPLEMVTPPPTPLPPPPPPSNIPVHFNLQGSVAAEQVVCDSNQSKRKNILLIWSLGAIAIGLFVTIALVFTLMPSKTTPSEPSDSKELIEMIKNDVEEMQSKTEEARRQLEQHRARSAQLEKERTQLRMEVSRLAEANTF